MTDDALLSMIKWPGSAEIPELGEVPAALNRVGIAGHDRQPAAR